MLLLVLNRLLQLHQHHLNLGRNVRFLINLRQRVHCGQPVCNRVGAREVHVPEQQIAGHLEHFLLGHQRQHGFDSLFALAVVAWAGIHYDVIFAHRNVVKNLAGRLNFVNRGHVRLAVYPDDPQNPFGIVDFGDQVQNDLAGLFDGPRHIVVEMEVGQVHLPLLALQRLARHIAGQLLRRVKDAHHRLKVVTDFHCGLHDAHRRRLRLQSARRWRRFAVDVPLFVSQNGHGLNVGHRPFVFVAFVLAFRHHPFGLGRQSNGLGHAGTPKVVHPLRVLSEPHQPVLFALALDHHLGAVAGNDRNPSPWPFLFLEDLHCGQLAPLDRTAPRRFALDLNNAGRVQRFFGRQFILVSLRAVRQHYQRRFLTFNVEILGNADIFLHHPFGG